MIYFKLCLTILIVAPVALAQNYCSKTLCGTAQHVACNNKGSFSSKCAPNAKIVPITNTLRDQIVRKHNEYRNQIAGGFQQFKSAARMATIVWNDELAKIAVFNVKQCQIKHDACRNTNQFHYAGQNLAQSGWKGTGTGTIPDVINSHMQMWFNEYKDCSMVYINKYPSSTNGKVIGHFTALVQDKSTHVGCAIMRQLNSNGFTEQLMACNYAYTNMLGDPVYKTGKAASECKTGVDKNYKFLCSTKEKYELISI